MRGEGRSGGERGRKGEERRREERRGSFRDSSPLIFLYDERIRRRYSSREVLP